MSEKMKVENTDNLDKSDVVEGMISDEVEQQISNIVELKLGDIQKLEDEVRQAISKAENAVESAKKAKDIKVKLFKGNKDAVEGMQQAIMAMADAQISEAQALAISFEYHEKFAVISKELMALGVMGIAQNDLVVKKLKLHLQNASKEEISELEKREIEDVIRRLCAQRDQMKKIEDNRKGVVDNRARITAVEDKNEEQDTEIFKGIQKDREHDLRIREGREKDLQHDLKLEKVDEKNLEQDIALKEVQAINEAQEKRIDELQKQVEDLKKIINLSGTKSFFFYKKGVVISTFIMSIIAIVLGIVSLLF